jgi:hypothetical protein
MLIFSIQTSSSPGSPYNMPTINFVPAQENQVRTDVINRDGSCDIDIFLLACSKAHRYAKDRTH